VESVFILSSFLHILDKVIKQKGAHNMLRIEKKIYAFVNGQGFMKYVDEAELIPNATNKIELGKIFSNSNNIAWEICFPHEAPREQGLYCIPVMFCIQGMRNRIYAMDCLLIQSYTICNNGVGIETGTEEDIPA